eukprot:TRINITY_DN1169_c0_g1_i1.p1 TRINITY_DN1169_c0_g1~~TRINITY_DN1169_c0_g1_i1.p1  ORF type:complete len:144 (-),score=28.38 TRINITY_DN1169_c0_g1_i1:67-498(-)
MSATAVKNLLTNCVYLEDSEIEIEGIRIYGSPWQPEFCDWGFNVERGLKIKQYWDMIPVGTDVLITHGPPEGQGGFTFNGFDAGCEELIRAIYRVKPVVHLFGHVHEGYGVTKDETTYYINGSNLNFKYKPVNSAIVFDILLE